MSLGQPIILEAESAAVRAVASAKFIASSSTTSNDAVIMDDELNENSNQPLHDIALNSGNNAFVSYTESKQSMRPTTQTTTQASAQTQNLQQLQNATAEKLKFSNDRDRVRWNQTPTAEPHRGSCSKEGDVQPPTPKPFEPSFPSISEDIGLPMQGGAIRVTMNHVHPPRKLEAGMHLHGHSPLASPALSTMTTGSSGWHQWNDDFDYDAVAELTGANKHDTRINSANPTNTANTTGTTSGPIGNHQHYPPTLPTDSGLTREKLLEFQAAAIHRANSMQSLQSMNSIGSMQSFLPHTQEQQQNQSQPHPQPQRTASQNKRVTHRSNHQSRRQYQPQQTRVIIYRAGTRFGEPVGAGQLMTIPVKAAKYMKPHDASALFDEFLYDAAVRLGLARKSDPLSAPPSPSRRRRMSILHGEIKRLELDQNKGRYVDNSFLHGLKNKLEVLRLGDEATRRSDSNTLMGNNSSFVSALRGATAGGGGGGGADSGSVSVENSQNPEEDDDADSLDRARGQIEKKIDVSRLSLWHSKYKAQIRDFSSIRDGDALLLRSLDEDNSSGAIDSNNMRSIRADLPSVEKADGNGAVEDGSSTILEDTHGGSMLGLRQGSVGSLDSVRSRSSPGRRGSSGKSPSRRRGRDGEEEEIEDEERERREDGLRLRRIGLAQLLDAIKSKRTLFGKRLKGARQAFQAMDRDSDGIVSPEDIQAAMSRLDIKLSKAAIEELVDLLRAGDFISSGSGDNGGEGGGGRLRMEDFIDLLHTVAEEDVNGDDGRDWLGVAAGLGNSLSRSSVLSVRSSKMRSSTMLRGRKRKRRRRHNFKDQVPDTRPDEELMWDIESHPDDPQPLRTYAERLVVRGQTSRAQSYLKRALLMTEREVAASFEHDVGGTSGFGVDGDAMGSLHGTSVVVDGATGKYGISHAGRIDLMLRLGTLYVLDEHYGAAQQMYEEAVSLAPLSTTEYSHLPRNGVPPTKADPLTLLGSLLERLREYDRAEEAYLRALAIDTEHADALLRMANLLADVRGDAKGSITYYERAMSAANQDYNDADVPIRIGRRRMLETYRCYATFRNRVLGDYRGSLALLKSAMAVPTPRSDRMSSSESQARRRSNPSWRPREHQDKAAILCEMGRVELARVADNPMLEEEVSRPSALTSDGSIDRRQGGSALGAIVDLFDRALEALPSHVGTKLELAMLLSQRSKSPKDRTRATHMFEEVLAADGENCRALLGLARHLDYTGTGAPRYVEDLYTRAITRVDAILRAAPRPNLPLDVKIWEPRLALAEFLEFRRADPTRALEAYESAVVSSPHEPRVLCALAVFKAHPPPSAPADAHDPDAAEALYRSALDSDPLFVDALLGLAELLWHQRGEMDAAESLFKRAASIADSTRVGRSKKMKTKKKTDGSELSGGGSSLGSSMSVTSVPSNGGVGSRALVATVFRQYGMFLTSKGKHKSASKYFGRAIAVDPNHAPTRTAYALVLAYHIRDYELAEQQLLRALELDARSPEAFFHLGRLYEEHVVQLRGVTSDGGRKAKSRAMQCYRSALDIDPNHVSTLVRMGTLLAEKAAADRTSSSNGMPVDRQALLERANEAFSRAVANSGDQDADTYYAYGTFLLQNQAGDRDSRTLAENFLSRSIEIDPAHVLALDELAHLHETNGKLQKAETLWIRALDVNPGEAPSHADFVHLLERVRSRCYAAEEAMTRETAGPEAAKSLLLHQQLRKFATLKAMMSYRMTMEDAGGSQLPPAASSLSGSKEDDGIYMRHDREYLRAFRQQFKKGSRRKY